MFNKKGVELLLPLASLGIILILLSAIFLLNAKKAGLEEVGDKSLEMIKGYKEVEKELFYLDSSVRLSVEEISNDYSDENDFINQFKEKFTKRLKLNNMPTGYSYEIKDSKLIGKVNYRIWWIDGQLTYLGDEGNIVYSKSLNFEYPVNFFDYEKFKKSYRIECLKTNTNLENCFDISYDFETLKKEDDKIIVHIRNNGEIIKTEIDLNK
ncbi:MAG: hypothetical protein PHG05_01965 [Candidatus Nanoarchaeia archaeon]|nr:hypothetical protein [Candidatus Nanoarchaeia archaeon]